MSKITGITVCVDYSDFLRETIKYNKKHFDSYIVITTPEDKKTIDLCKDEGVTIICTTAFSYQGTFNKGLALSLALKNIVNLNNWICIHDADTCLPFNFRDKLDLDNMDIEKLYGCSRKFVPTYDDWIKGLNDNKYFDKFESIPGIGCGFMQLFHVKSKAFKENRDNLIYGSYPTAEQCDIHFLYHWCPPPDPKPEKLNMDCYHLSIYHGTAHAGRKLSKVEEFKKDFKDQKVI